MCRYAGVDWFAIVSAAALQAGQLSGNVAENQPLTTPVQGALNAGRELTGGDVQTRTCPSARAAEHDPDVPHVRVQRRKLDRHDLPIFPGFQFGHDVAASRISVVVYSRSAEVRPLSRQLPVRHTTIVPVPPRGQRRPVASGKTDAPGCRSASTAGVTFGVCEPGTAVRTPGAGGEVT